MDKREYLETVIGQIRFNKAKQMIADELENHIDDQMEAFVAGGMEEDEACQKAIAEMGDPVDVGVALDHVHRPKFEWKIPLLVLCFSIAGIVLQSVVKAESGSVQYTTYIVDISRQFFYLGIGFCLMLFFCFFDYTRIGRFAKEGAAIVLVLLYSLLAGAEINGQKGYFAFMTERVSVGLFTYLYIPFFGGILYAYKNQGRKGFIKSIAWMMLPVFLTGRLPNLSLACALFVIMMLQMCFVIKKGWFKESKVSIRLLVSILLGSPVIMVLYFLLFGREYQKERLTQMLYLFTPSYAHSQNYQMNTVHRLLSQSRMIGKTTEGASGLLPDLSGDYVLTCVYTYYGMLAAIALLMLFGYFIYKIFKISVCQKNQLGFVIGIGCSLVFTQQIVMHVLVNLAVMPPTSVFLPFFSYGGTGTIVSFSLIGILLSIYRYQSVLPETPVFTKRVPAVKSLFKSS